MEKIIAILNQKGGVGKSTTALALGAGLRLAGRKVLFVDLDSQGNLSYALEAETGVPGVFEALNRPAETVGLIQRLAEGEVLSSSPSLTGADTVFTVTGKEYRLREALATLDGLYDYVVVDTPPSLGVLTINALTAAHGAIVPAQADVFSLQGISQLGQTIEVVRQYCNPNLKILGVLLTRHNPRSVLGRDLAEVIEQAAQGLGSRLFKTTIREAVTLREAAAMRKNIFSYAPKSKVAQDYQDLVTEFGRLNL